MNAITILEKELKQVRKIGFRLASKMGSIPEKDMERYKKEVAENDVLEKDLIDAIHTLKSNNVTEKDATAKPHWDAAFELGRAATIPWDGWTNDDEELSNRVRREYAARLERISDQMRASTVRQWLNPNTTGNTLTGHGTFTGNGMQTPRFDTDGAPTPND